MNDMSETKSEHQIIMEERMSGIEVAIAEFIAEGKEPECIILNQNTIDEVFTHYVDKETKDKIDWTKPVAFAFCNGEIELRIFRTIDIPYGQYIIR